MTHRRFGTYLATTYGVIHPDGTREEMSEDDAAALTDEKVELEYDSAYDDARD